MSAKQINLTQGTSEWMEWRRKGVGASDVAALFGKSPYKTKRDLWFEKAGLGEPDDEDRSYIFRRGHETEAELRELFSKHTKIEINPACFEKDEIFLASLDGYDKGLGILEAKLVGREALKKAATGEIPEHHHIQIQSQLFSSDSDKAFWGGKAPGVKGGVVVEIGRDERFIKLIQKEVEEFWASLKTMEMPDLTKQDTMFLTNPKYLLLAEELCQLKEQFDDFKKRYSIIEDALLEAAVHTKVKCGPLMISQVERAGSVDYLKIPEVQALAKDYIEQFRKRASKYKQIRFGKAD